MDTGRARLIKKAILSSSAFTKTTSGKIVKMSGMAWEDYILSLNKFSLLTLRVYAGSKMKGNGGKL